MEPINLDQVVSAVRTQAEQHPDFKYSEHAEEWFSRHLEYDDDFLGECVYFFENGEPACIVGHALHDLGVTLDDIHDMNSNTGVIELCRGIGVIHCDVPDYNPKVRFLEAIQNLQDQDKSWGAALVQADLAAGGNAVR